MTITNVSSGLHTAPPAKGPQQSGGSFRQLREGQVLELQIGKRLAERQFQISLGKNKHVVETHLQLRPGSVVRATVVAVGEKLELRYVDERVNPSSVENAGDAPVFEEQSSEQEQLLNDLAAQCAVQLKDREQEAIADAMRVAEEPQLMAASGLFLAKLEQPVAAQTLHAIYLAQSWPAIVPSNAEASEDRIEDAISNLKTVRVASDFFSLGSDTDAAEQAGDALATALEQMPDGLAEGQALSVQVDLGDRDSRDGQRHLAHQLLNEQDFGSLAYSYGTVPLLLGDQLIELEVVMFRERYSKANQTSVRKLVMTLQTASFGKVEVMAQAVGERLTIALGSDSPGAVATLAGYAEDVRALVARLGWQVDTVKYDVSTKPMRAAEHVVRHVLSAGTIDRMF